MSKPLQVMIVLGMILMTGFLIFSFQQKEKSKADYVEFQQLERLKEQGKVEEITFEEWKKQNPTASDKYLEWRKQQLENPNKPEDPKPEDPKPEDPKPEDPKSK
jgi:hypothetical protein